MCNNYIPFIGGFGGRCVPKGFDVLVGVSSRVSAPRPLPRCNVCAVIT